MMYLCDRFKICRNSPMCGVKCILTEDKQHRAELRNDQVIECLCLMDREIIEDWLRETDVEYKVDGMNVVLKPSMFSQ